MQRHRVALGMGAFLAFGAFATWMARSSLDARRPTTASPSRPAGATALDLRGLLDSGPVLRPSAKALALDGKRVRIAGFMVEMEEPLRGAIYLAPRPLRLDESGAGTGDLPLESVLVEVPGFENRVIPHVEGALEGTGIFEVGNRADDQGRVSNFRLRLDPDQRLVQPPAAVAAASQN